MKGATKVFITLGQIFQFWWIFPIIYGAKIKRKLNNNEPITTGQKVVVLLFVNMIAGILLLAGADK